jgi:TP901 family phage tail tape measure protein
MASAAGIRLGKVFVEIGADPSKLFGALNKLNKRIGSIGQSMTNFGGRMTALGAGMVAPIALAVRAGTSFESVLKNISASTGATAGDIGRINAAAMQMSEAMGTGPTAIAQGFLELLKAGMPLEAVLGGAGKAALEFAKVGELSVADAAVVMSDAMNVFGVDAANAANTMSAAADASSTSIQEIAMAFTQVSAVAAQSNQGIDDVAAALALMANAGVKGSDAGTSLKNMFAKLKSPVDSAATALESIGLSTESFRDASGAMLPLAQQIEVLRNATAGLDQAAKDDVFQRVFGTDAIRAALILTEAGAAGIDGMKKSMGDALPVSEKFRQLQSGLAGVAEALMGSLERLAIAITSALGPALAIVAKFLIGATNGVTQFVKENQQLAAAVGIGVAALTAAGTAITGLGLSLRIAATGMSGLTAAATVALSPIALLTNSGIYLAGTFRKQMASVATSTAGAAASLMSLATTATTHAAAGLANLTAAATRFGASAVATATAAFPTFFRGFNRALAAGDGFFAAAYRGFRGVAMASSQFRAVLATISGSRFAEFASQTVSSLQYTAKAFSWWAAGVTMQLTAYIQNAAAAAVASVTSAFRIAAAWFATALPGVTAFVTAAVTGIATYLASAAGAVAASAVSAAGVAAAWLAPLAPFALLAAAIGGVATIAFTLSDEIGAALSGLGSFISDAAGRVAKDFAGIKEIGIATFKEIYASVEQGDLAGAMQVAIAGLKAVFTVGANAFLNEVDRWGVNLLNAFDFYVSQIPFLRFATDTYEFKVFGSSNSSTADQRADDRFANLDSRTADRRKQSKEAFAGLDEMLQARAASRPSESLEPTSTPLSVPRELGPMGPMPPQDLNKPGSLETPDWLQSMIDAEAERRKAEDAAKRLAEENRLAVQSQSEAVGTFSSVGIGGMGFGSNLQQRIADAAAETAKNTAEIAKNSKGEVG